jgi:hypothetical protein
MMDTRMSLNDRVRGSGNYFRIRDAEREMLKKKAHDDEAKVIRERKKKMQHRNIMRLQNRNGDESSQSTSGKSRPIPSEPSQLFSKFVVNDNPKYSKYFLCDELLFPKIILANKLGPNSIDHYWMSGFFDRQERDADKIANARMAEALKASSANILNKIASPKVKRKKKKEVAEVDSFDDNEYLRLMDNVSLHSLGRGGK